MNNKYGTHNNKEKLLMIIPKDIHKGVIESQMLGLANHYHTYFEVEIAVPNSIDNVNVSKNISLFRYNNYTDLIKIIKHFDVVYFRNILNFVSLFIFCKIYNTNIIYDFRGLTAYETFYKNKNRIKFFIFFILEFMAYIFSDTIQCVSKNMKLELITKFYIKKKINVIPCLANKCIRRNDICQERIKFVYIGGLSSWQNIDLIISVSLKIQEEIESVFTFITNNPHELETKIKKTRLKNYNIISGNNEFVQNNLVKQDFGFLFRDDLLFNRISSPIKFLEYTSNGVVPIITPYVGDFSNDVITNEIGVIFNQDICKLITDIKKIILKMEIYRKRLFIYSLPLTWGNFDDLK